MGDGEAETGPLATASHTHKLLGPSADGAAFPILSRNGYKIRNPTTPARTSHDELETFFEVCGCAPLLVKGDEPELTPRLMAATAEDEIARIHAHHKHARGGKDAMRPLCPMIVLISSMQTPTFESPSRRTVAGGLAPPRKAAYFPTLAPRCGSD